MVSDLDFRLTPNYCKSTGTRFYLAQVSDPIIENRFSQISFSNFRFVDEDGIAKSGSSDDDDIKKETPA